MKEALSKLSIIPFSTISLKREDYWGEIGPMFFAELLRAKLIISGVKVVNPENIVVLEKNEFGRYFFSLLISIKEEGVVYQKKLVVTINKKGLSVMFETFYPDAHTGKKWGLVVETTIFISIKYQLNEKFPGIIKTLI